MNRRNVVLAAITAFVLFATFLVGFGWFSSGPNLIILLRCKGEVSGTLSIANLQNGEPESTESFGIKTVCEAGKIEFSGYRGEEGLQFMFERGVGEMVELVAEYGFDIQVDKLDGFYMVLKIMDVPPFIANDRI